MTLTTGQTFTDPGYTVSDPDHDESELIVSLRYFRINQDGTETEISSFANQPINTQGTYLVRYTVREPSPCDLSHSSTRTVHVVDTVDGNNPPVALDDAYTTPKNTTLTVGTPGVLVNDSDPDNDPLTVELVTATQHGTLNLSSNGSFVYTPNNDYVGQDTFTYRVLDGNGGSDTALVTITIQEEDDDDDDNGGGGSSRGGGNARRYTRTSEATEEVEEPIVLGECVYLLDFLRIDFANDPVEVMKLQAFLRAFEGFDNVEVNGIFDQATFQAVNAFQVRYAEDVLIPWGYGAHEPTGYVYVTTKAKINEIFCNKAAAFSDAEKLEMAAFQLLLLQAKLNPSYGQVAIKDIGIKDITYTRNNIEDVKVGSKDTFPQIGSGTSTIAQNIATSSDIEITDPEVNFETGTSTVASNRNGIAGVAAGIYSGLEPIINPIIEFIFSTAFLLLILALILIWLVSEWYKGHKERKGQK